MDGLALIPQLFLCYLYLTGTLAYAVQLLFAYFSPLWTYEVCGRYVVFEWIQTILVILPAETILALRIYAMSGRRWYFIALLAPVIAVQFALAIFVVSQRGNIALPTVYYALADPFHVCILFPQLSIAKVDEAFLALTLAFDSIVFFLTLVLSFLGIRKAGRRTPILAALQCDGTLYFFAIFSGNLLWLIFSLHNRPSLKFIQAIPSLMLTSVMINRLNLSLKKTASKQFSINWSLDIFEQKANLQATLIASNDIVELQVLDTRYQRYQRVY
ncbi:hypothetical protein HYPSUDRAFT_44764 [Hypholoma sublateritium FD-334 SS-4]|uniref:Uncharacterized protein n=1 Tax=Hypholoma sublateritium (strain FD-334 SS-4) TaxID=945553 RepID=A0A0D2M6T1_HYPSF|nr:hypothetical protein HYPSUDRAFT_44764 [Hypholoma sublateritium FD-334 SS-4]